MDEDIFKELIKENLKIIKKIGKGVYSRVYLAKHLETHVDYALKIIDCENSNVKKYNTIKRKRARRKDHKRR